MGRAPQADPSVEAAVVPGKTAGAAAALSPPNVLPAPAPASAEAVVVLPVEPPVVADAEMAEAPLLEVGDRKPVSLAEEVPDASTAGGPDALEEGGAEPRPVLGSDDLIPVRRDPNERRGQALRFWTRGASKPLFVLDDEREEQSRDELRECAEAAMGSLRSMLGRRQRRHPSLEVFADNRWSDRQNRQGHPSLDRHQTKTVDEVIPQCGLVQFRGPRAFRPIITGPAWPPPVTGLTCKGTPVITVCNPAL
jgi:hypothetical protein